jgi:hypothetical protein
MSERLNTTNARPWDRREPITVALERNGLKSAFDAAIEAKHRVAAIELLCRAGATTADAERMITLALGEAL